MRWDFAARKFFDTGEYQSFQPIPASVFGMLKQKKPRQGAVFLVGWSVSQGFKKHL